jgi:hypothetical protein
MKYFNEKQLAQEIRPPHEHVQEALQAGQIERVHYLLNEMAAGHKGLDVLGLQWLPKMFGKIRTDMGEDFLNKVLDDSAEFLLAPYAEEFAAGQEKEVFYQLARMWRWELGANVVPLEETEDQITFALSPCGSGGRIMLEGWAEANPTLFAPCSDGTPIYCQGCKSLQKAFNKACGATVWESHINETIPGSCEMRFYKQKTKGQTLFTPLEIYQVTKPRAIRALGKVLMGDLDILDLIKDQQIEWRPLHDLRTQWYTCIMSLVYKEKGTDYMDEFLKVTYDSSFAMFYGASEALDDVTLFRSFVQLWHYHQATFRVEEEEDRFVFILDPCGSGGRLVRGEMDKGRFEYGTGIPCFMDEAADINFNREQFPVYCTHCASSNRDQFDGNPLPFVVDGHARVETQSPCRQYLYKKGKRNVDPQILAQVGRSTATPSK